MSSRSAPSSLGIAICILLAIIALSTIARQLVTSRRLRGDLELLRAENRLLDQEIRLLRQHLEAERIQSAALARRLRGAGSSAPDAQSAPASASKP